MSKKKNERKRKLLKREQLVQKKRRLDREVKGLRLRGMSDADPKIQNLEAEKTRILRWVMYLMERVLGRGYLPESFPTSVGRRARRRNTPMRRLAEATPIAARGNYGIRTSDHLPFCNDKPVNRIPYESCLCRLSAPADAADADPVK